MAHYFVHFDTEPSNTDTVMHRHQNIILAHDDASYQDFHDPQTPAPSHNIETTDGSPRANLGRHTDPHDYSSAHSQSFPGADTSLPVDSSPLTSSAQSIPPIWREQALLLQHFIRQIWREQKSFPPPVGQWDNVVDISTTQMLIHAMVKSSTLPLGAIMAMADSELCMYSEIPAIFYRIGQPCVSSKLIAKHVT